MFCNSSLAITLKTQELFKFLKLKLKLQCTPTAMLASLTHPCSGALVTWYEPTYKGLLFSPFSHVGPSPLCMVLEFHFSCAGDGRGGGVLSSNPLASTFPGANRIWIVFGWRPNRAANGTACPWLLCVLVGHISWWCCLLSNYLFGWGWGAVYVPSPPKYYALWPLYVHLCITLRSWPWWRMTWPI